MGNHMRSIFSRLVPHVAYQKEMKHIFKMVKQGLHGESVASYARTFLWNINKLSTMPNLEDLLTRFKRDSFQQ